MGTEQRMRRVLVLVLSTDREMEIKILYGVHIVPWRCPHTGGVVEESEETEQRMREFLLGF